MLNKESVYLEILENYFERKLVKFTQKEISVKLGISIGLVNKTVKSLVEIGVVTQRHRANTLIDAKKLLLYWYSQRKLNHDIMYKTHFDGSIKEIETSMPPDVVFTAYSGYRLKYGDAPADYDKVFVYCENVQEFKKRFPPSKKYENVFLLKKTSVFETRDCACKHVVRGFVELARLVCD